MVSVDPHKGPWSTHSKRGHCDPNVAAARPRAGRNLSRSLFRSLGWQNVKQAWCRVTDALFFLEMHIHKNTFYYHYSSVVCSCLPRSSRNFVSLGRSVCDSVIGWRCLWTLCCEKHLTVESNFSCCRAWSPCCTSPYITHATRKVLSVSWMVLPSIEIRHLYSLSAD